MISVQLVFERVQDLSRKDKAGYMSSEEFNRDLGQAQNILFRYFYQQFEDRQQIVDSLNPFHKTVNLPIANGFCEFPADYRHRTEVGYLFVENPLCGLEQPTVEPIPMPYLNANEVMETLVSAIRKPSKEKKRVYHTFINNKIEVHPYSLTGYIKFKYLAVPPTAIYATTLDLANDQENYDPLNSIDLIWNQQDTDNLVDLLLFFKGLEVRESALLEWVGMKKQFTQSPIQS
jgi:hypothetical protein